MYPHSTLVLRGLKKQDQEFKIPQGYIIRPCQKKQNGVEAVLLVSHGKNDIQAL